ncbi:MAG: hypothetical protein J7L26_01930 [Candidatus Aminicenantes bacterium]|nr:hypothetical protein [Candidatus Aminicenantes bacterium]
MRPGTRKRNIFSTSPQANEKKFLPRELSLPSPLPHVQVGPLLTRACLALTLGVPTHLKLPILKDSSVNYYFLTVPGRFGDVSRPVSLLRTGQQLLTAPRLT